MCDQPHATHPTDNLCPKDPVGESGRDQDVGANQSTNTSEDGEANGNARSRVRESPDGLFGRHTVEILVLIVGVDGGVTRATPDALLSPGTGDGRR